jgi:hypothetical protein
MVSVGLTYTRFVFKYLHFPTQGISVLLLFWPYRTVVSLIRISRSVLAKGTSCTVCKV